MDTELHTTLRDMLRRYRLTAIYVFGSRATEIAARVTGAPSADHSDSDEEAESQLYYLRRAGDLAPFYREQLRDLLGTAP